MSNHGQVCARRVQALTITATLTDELRRFRARTRSAWSLRILAEHLGISRGYLKQMLRKHNTYPVRPRVAGRLHELMQNPPQGRAMKPRRVRAVELITRFRVAKVTVVECKPIRCRGHNQDLFPRTPTQVYCRKKKECVRLWRRKQGANAKRERSRRPVARRARAAAHRPYRRPPRGADQNVRRLSKRSPARSHRAVRPARVETREIKSKRRSKSK